LFKSIGRLIAILAFGLNSVAIAQSRPAEPSGAAPAQLATEINETIVKVPVTVEPLFGGARTGEMLITHFKPPGNGPFPAVLMHHGRGVDRANPGRWRYINVAQYWTRRGFAVFIPTRLGYGDTGLEPDPEFTGPCNSKRYDVAAAAVVVQSKAGLDYASQQPWVDKNKMIVMGQSMGGFTTILTMGQKYPGVIAGINFAGGAGGDPILLRGNPCSPFMLGSLFGSAGKFNQGSTPMLWIYSENDLYWGPSLPKKWFDAYTEAGGKAQFTQFPPIGADGHSLINTGFGLWRPIVDQFISSLGFATPKNANAPETSNFADLADTSKVPLVNQETKDVGYKRFLNTDVPRAFAIGPKGEWSFQSGERSIERALERCAGSAKTDCKLYAVDDAVVWKP
jgi:dienelactone hydrolase